MDPSAPWRALESPADPGPPPPPEPGTGSGAVPLGTWLAAAGALLLAICAAVVVLLAASAPARPVAVSSEAAAETEAIGGGLVVEVAGAVVHPGVYDLPPGSRVRDAIEAAGGYSADVDAGSAETALNLAAKVADGEVVRVPRRGDGASPDSSRASSAPATGLVNLNTASEGQLDALPGIGPVTAAKIVAARQQKPFTSVDELVTRKVVSASVLAKIRDLVTV